MAECQTGAVGPPPVRGHCCSSGKQDLALRYNPQAFLHFSILFFNSQLYFAVIYFWSRKWNLWEKKKNSMGLKETFVVGLQETSGFLQLELSHSARTGWWILTQHLHTRCHSAVINLAVNFYFRSFSPHYTITVTGVSKIIHCSDRQQNMFKDRTHERLPNPS